MTPALKDFQSKGTDLINLRRFVRETFGRDGYSRWIAVLSPKARESYEDIVPILATEWYSSWECYIQPLEITCQLFFSGDFKRGSLDFGRFCGAEAVSGIYKAFFCVSSTGLILKLAGKIFSMYMRPGVCSVVKSKRREFVIRFTGTPPRESVDYSFAGFIEGLLYNTGRKSYLVKLEKALSAGDPFTEVGAVWKGFLDPPGTAV